MQIPRRTHKPYVFSPGCRDWKVFRIGTVRYNWPMSAHASQAFSIAHCTDSEDMPLDRIHNVFCETHVHMLLKGLTTRADDENIRMRVFPSTQTKIY